MLGISFNMTSKWVLTQMRNIWKLPTLKNHVTSEASYMSQPFQLYKLKSGPSPKTLLTRNDALTYYTQLQTVRQIEIVAADFYKQKLAWGLFHLYSGQEAIAVGTKAALRPHDAVITAYRTHGWLYLMGTDLLGVFAELIGRKSGCARGKGGSMHVYSKHFYGGNGIVGAQVPLGVGIALAFKYRGTDGICVAVYGDGAANQGQIFEAYNMAKLWNIPVIFICENNGYAVSTKAHLSSANAEFYTKGDYIPGIRVDGMDVVAVREAAMYAVQHCINGKGPIILEALTYRYHGRSFNDPTMVYRTRDEVEKVKRARDPIISFKKKIIMSNLVTTEELKNIDLEIKSVVNKAAAQAKLDEEIGLDELSADIYSKNYENNVRNVTPFNPLKHKRVNWIGR